MQVTNQFSQIPVLHISLYIEEKTIGKQEGTNVWSIDRDTTASSHNLESIPEAGLLYILLSVTRNHKSFPNLNLLKRKQGTDTFEKKTHQITKY